VQLPQLELALILDDAHIPRMKPFSFLVNVTIPFKAVDAPCAHCFWSAEVNFVEKHCPAVIRCFCCHNQDLLELCTSTVQDGMESIARMHFSTKSQQCTTRCVHRLRQSESTMQRHARNDNWLSGFCKAARSTVATHLHVN
jgi:hypothetical protein